MIILIAGDFVPIDRVKTDLEKNNYHCFNNVQPLFNSVDYTIVNLESPVLMRDAKPIDKTGPNLRCTEDAIACIAHSNVSCLTLANNHFRDQGQVGVEDTLNACQRYGIDYVGGGRDITEAEQILYKNVSGEILAIINLCENEWSIAGQNYGGSAPLHPVKNFYVIQEARKKADYVVVIVHGGIEGYQYPTPQMQEIYRFFIDSGADTVINHHQHCFSGYEEYKGKPIFYGLGNFCFDRKGQRHSVWNEGYLVRLRLEAGVYNYEIIPYTQCDEKPIVELMDEKKKLFFYQKISEINKVIGNADLLQNQFQEKVDSIYEYRLLALEPFTNNWIKKLQKKHLFPRLMRREQLKSMLMRMNCESNRETLINVLKKHFSL